jgi:ubiquinone/menaquinone biosynthesis C-methylase UbiE
VESASFDSIASVYDETRIYDETCFNAALDYIVDRFPPLKYPALFEPGIGTGRIAIPFAERGYHVTGADISLEMLKILADKVAGRNPPLPVTYIQQDITSLPYNRGSFDIAIASHIFHVVREWKKAVDEVFRVLKPGAPLITMTTGNGYVIPDVIERYKAISPEYGYPIRRLGINNRLELYDYVTKLGRHVERINDRWRWQQPCRIDKFLADLRAGIYSPTKLVPEDIHIKIVDRLENELKQRYGNLAIEVEVPNEIVMSLVLPVQE